MGLLVKFLIVAGDTVLTPQVAGNPGFISAGAIQWAAIEAAAGDLRLLEYTGGRMLQFLGTGLAAVGMLVGLAMVEDVPRLPDVQHPAVGVAQVVQGFAFLLIAV